MNVRARRDASRGRSLNGDAWSARRDFDRGARGFTNEWYGLLKSDYRSIRHLSMLRDLSLEVEALDPPTAPRTRRSLLTRAHL